MPPHVLAIPTFVPLSKPYPRHALQSVEILPVTQIRASDDYVPSAVGPDQWRIGSSSMFAHAVGLAPFKVITFSLKDFVVWWLTPPISTTPP